MVAVPSPPPVSSPIPRATPVSSARAAVVVCGSVNYDTFFLLDHLPAPGETVIEAGSFSALGGKGANQAVACSRAGVSTYLLATVGEDSAGDFLLEELSHQGVHIREVNRCSEPTGQAVVLGDSVGENSIIVRPGANYLTNPRDYLSRMAPIMEQHEVPVLLAQGELRPEYMKDLPLLAECLGARLVLNMAPVSCRDSALLAAADPLILNETEAQELLGLNVIYDSSRGSTSDSSSVSSVSVAPDNAQLISVCSSVVVTLGSRGAVIIRNTDDASSASEQKLQVEHIPAYSVGKVVDTTGAGDAFCGTLAAALAQGMGLSEAVQCGCAAGALATQKVGAAQSYATWEQIILFMAHPEGLQ